MDNKKEELTFTDYNNQDKAILGTLEGPCADFMHGTRNGRKYDESLWEKVFSDPVVNELIDNGGIPGELDHPADRDEIDSSRIAVLMKEKPKKKNGQLWAKFSILNTPLGKIAYTLAKAGFKLGISSRGSGETFEGPDGEEHVDEDTYNFTCFDLVLVPSVKNARLQLITEGLEKKFDYKKALRESLENSSEEDKKLMKDTLHDLEIELDEKDCINNQTPADEAVDINASEEDLGASDVGPELVDEMQNLIKANKELEEQIISLQEKLSVSYTKESEYEDEIEKQKAQIKVLSESKKNSDALKKRLDKLLEDLTNANDQIAGNKVLVEKLKTDNGKQITMTEEMKKNLLDKESTIKDLNRKVNKLTESISSITKENSSTKARLNEQIETLKKDSEIKNKEYSSKLQKANKLVEKYRDIAKKAVNKYIDSQALRIGVKSEEIKSQLKESYTFSDIDAICEELQDYKINISKLPFTLNENVKMKVKKQNETISKLVEHNSDDEIDDSLIALSKLR